MKRHHTPETSVSKSYLQTVLADYLPQLIELRRHLHAHPELSGKEYQTAALVADKLSCDRWRVRKGVGGGTGLLAELGPVDGPVVGLRVDMDALPVEEDTGLAYASHHRGVMHACGHDLHTCIGLGVGRLIAEADRIGNGLSTRVRLLFQPAEELGQGARCMRDDGAVEDLVALFGVHVYPSLPVGTIGVRRGNLTAAAGELEIEVIGESGHGARPHQAVDAIWIASRVIGGLQEAITRQLDALQPVVISFGRIEGGGSFNVIADRVRLLGTVRCLDKTTHDALPNWITKTVQSICRTYGGETTIHYRPIAPPVYNDPALTDLLEHCAIDVLGAEHVKHLDHPSLGAEDFAEFLREARGAMFRLGVAGPEGCAPLHSCHFLPDERSLGVGVRVLTAALLAWMEHR